MSYTNKVSRGSLVAEVLKCSDQIQRKAIQEDLETLTSKLKDMELEVHQMAESIYVNFRPSLESAEFLQQRVGEFYQQAEALQHKINKEVKEQLSISTSEFQSLNSKLTEAKAIEDSLERLTSIHNLLELSSQQINDKVYGEAAVTLCKIDQLIKNFVPLADENKIKILKAMKEKGAAQKCKLACALSNIWKDSILWHFQPEGIDQGDGQNMDISKLEEISLSVTSFGRDSLTEMVDGMHIQALLQIRMKHFAEKFKNIVVPFIIENRNCTVELKMLGTKTTLVLSNQHKRKGSDTKSSSKTKGGKESDETLYVSVFANLLAVLKHMNSMLLCAEYGRHDSTLLEIATSSTSLGPDPVSADSQTEKKTLMSWLGQTVGPWLLGLLQQTVLAKAVPSNAKDLEGFSTVISATNSLQASLLDLGFLSPDNTGLSEYVKNVNMLFANKKSHSILESAHEFMRSSLHDTVAVSDDKPMGEWPPLVPGGLKKINRAEVASTHELSDNTLRMPKCRISQTIQTVITLAYETMEEATESSDECAVQMYYAVRSMFEFFCNEVPAYHRQTMEMFPQIAALHHNNCMFIAHHLMTLGHQFSRKMPPGTDPSFVDLIQEIRASGVDAFMEQIKRQRGLLLEYLEGAQGFVNVDEDKNMEAAKKSIKQVLLQLNLLQKIWKPVLPINVYKKAMGKLIHSVVEHVTNSVASLEDIAQTAAHNLIALFDPINKECGDLIILPGEVPTAELMRHVPSWSRLTEMQRILNASLSEIGDRWAEGKGPLAEAFSPLEVKQMIRALFQNTDRRANLLNSIK